MTILYVYFLYPTALNTEVSLFIIKLNFKILPKKIGIMRYYYFKFYQLDTYIEVYLPLCFVVIDAGQI